MQIKIITDYALRMLAYLAIKQSVVNSKQISDELSIPQKNVLSIGRRLKSENYVKIMNGPYGGYKLSQKPENICLFDIVFMFEGIGINCRPKLKQNDIEALIDNFYTELQDMIKQNLISKTLSDLISMKTVNE